ASSRRHVSRGRINKSVRQFLDCDAAEVGDEYVLVPIHADASGIANVAGVGDESAAGSDPFDDVVVETIGHIDVSRTVHNTVPGRIKPAGYQRGQRRRNRVPFSKGVGAGLD